MNKIDKILKAKTEAEKLAEDITEHFSQLTRSTEKFVFSVEPSGISFNIVIFHKGYGNKLVLNSIETLALKEFVDNIFNEEKEKQESKEFLKEGNKSRKDNIGA
ncbi:MAG: hypothetical protein JETCAE03_35760 [Ignavibacteriaceae bacterium]|jgi:hypothetical protein|nr:MAG: hypothetical protein JETCAE03_35760 [Ignavibacteriaceae bacterium]